MLLELLSDFQISHPRARPDRGQDPAGRAADLEQHPRADRGAQAPLPVPVARLPRPRARARDRPPALARARRDHRPQARRDRPPGPRARPEEAAVSIAESIDWARALLLLGANDIDDATFKETMSVIVKHRTDLDTVAARVGVKLQRRPMPPPRSPKSGQGHLRRHPRAAAGQRSTASCWPSPRTSASEGVAIGTSEMLDAFEALEHVAWTEQRDFKEALAATLAKSPDDRRVFDLVFDRFFFRAAEAEAARESITEAPGANGTQQQRHQPRHAPPADRGRAAGRLGRRAARPRPPGDRRLRPRRGLGRARRRRAADPPSARPADRAPARPARRTTRATTASRETSSETSSSTSGASSSAT